ncbi:hypothetical protein Ddye_007797 [Dipteronia dyeriana]|uniref:Uncharacterized protein n=1 Tax=Dipteronia dyeriana TaxID=168575 RepID=A0AAD9XKN5_9ROSI|nr:hypothetical protein Ddye_007797 [Dipteronia dyeriana]
MFHHLNTSDSSSKHANKFTSIKHVTLFGLLCFLSLVVCFFSFCSRFCGLVLVVLLLSLYLLLLAVWPFPQRVCLQFISTVQKIKVSSFKHTSNSSIKHTPVHFN